MSENLSNKMILFAYESVADFGFALPIFKSSLGSNALYIACASKPFDLRSRILDFQQYHTADFIYLSEKDHTHSSIGDDLPCIFFWNGRPHIGSITEIYDSLDNSLRDLMKFAPLSMVDLTLHSRSRRYRGSINNAYFYLYNRVSKRYAVNWVCNQAATHAVRIDLDRVARRDQSSFDKDQDEEISGLLGQVKSLRISKKRVRIVVPDELARPLEQSKLGSHELKYANDACRAIGFDFEISTRTGGLLEFPDEYATTTDDDYGDALSRREAGNAATGQLTDADPEAESLPNIEVTGVQLDVGEALKDHVRDYLINEAQKWLEEEWSATVSFSRERHNFRCAIRLHTSGSEIVSNGKHSEIYNSFSWATEKTITQLRKLSDRRKRKHKKRNRNSKDIVDGVLSVAYVVSPEHTNVMSADDLGGPVPSIVAEPSELPILTLLEAVAFLEVEKREFFMFRKPDSPHVNVVYIRDDGAIGWIDAASFED